jgi:hypothetical protein
MATIFDIRDFGARGDGATNDAPSLQAAIDACHAHGGGRVLVPAGGTYLSGSLRLRSYVDLHVERGALLQASGRWEDYTERFLVSALSAGVVGEGSEPAGIFLHALDAVGISLSGSGRIDGAGRHFIEEDLGYIYRCPNARPFTVLFRGCRDVVIRDVLLTEAALWTVRLTGCSRVVIHGITIDNDLKMPNADGIDLDRCTNVRISDCDISCSDDAISLKTCEEFAEYGPCQNVTVSNCTLRSTSSALVVGVDATDTIRDVVFDNCVVRESNRGLSVNLGQEGDFENILFSNMVVETRIFHEGWWGRGEPIYVSAVPWHDRVGTIRNVRFSNVLARSENGVYVAGSEPGSIAGVLLENVRVELTKHSRWKGGLYDRRPCQADGIYEHPTSGFHIDTAKDVTIRNCEVVWGDRPPDYYRYALETHRVDGFRLEGLRGSSAHPDLYPAHFDR